MAGKVFLEELSSCHGLVIVEIHIPSHVKKGFDILSSVF